MAAFITSANMLRIIRQTDIITAEIEGTVYKKPIYLFSRFEEKSLIAIQELISDTEKFLTEIYNKIEVVDRMKYVFEGKKPAYHNDLNCERLNSNFNNFEIPEEIKEKGPEEILRFRNWFKENYSLLERPDVFEMRLHMAFGVLINPKAINFTNSGSAELENLNLEQLESRIDSLLKEAGRFFYKSEMHQTLIRKFGKYTFLAYKDDDIQRNDTNYSDDEIKVFLRNYDEQFKKPLKYLLIQYYRVKYNPDLKMEGKLLEQLGFVPCGNCCSYTLSDLKEDYLESYNDNNNDGIMPSLEDDLPF
jgi:hypothetical protein